MIRIFFAQTVVPLDQVLSSWRVDHAASIEWLVVFVAIGVVTLLALIWAAFVRKKRRGRKHYHSHHHSSRRGEGSEVPEVVSAPTPPTKRHRHRRSHHRHRPRNPTLAETGGLPPIRPPDSPAAQP